MPQRLDLAGVQMVPAPAVTIPSGLTAEDADWVRRHLELAGCNPIPQRGRPPVDTSWVTMTWVR